MLIFIDSNILCSNYRMKRPSFEAAQRVGTIVLGQIVVDEVCNIFKENLVEQVTKVMPLRYREACAEELLQGTDLTGNTKHDPVLWYYQL